MVKTSKEYKEAIKKNRQFLVTCDVTLKNGTQLRLTNNDLMQDGVIIDSAVSNQDSFDVGAVVIGECRIKLNKMDGKYDFFDFDRAAIFVKVGIQLKETVEWIPMGTYTVESSTSTDAVISISAYDNLRKFDKEYSKSKLAYPATLRQILQDACQECGVSISAAQLEGETYIVQERPTDESLTFREILNWVCQILCKYAKCDAHGGLVLSWYEAQELENFILTDIRENPLLEAENHPLIIYSVPGKENSYDGGVYDTGAPYLSGDILDGGRFNLWDEGDSADAGTFNQMQTYHHVYQVFSLEVAVDDVEITGIRTCCEKEGQEKEYYQWGEEGYVLTIEDNGLIQTPDQAQEITLSLGQKLIGMKFRPFQSSHLSDPSIETGDAIYITDSKQRSYLSYITNISFTVGGAQSSSCGAESPIKKEATRFTEATKAFVKAKKETEKQISSYDEAVQALTSLITQSFGVYKTQEKLEDGSTIFYMHNKPTLEESDTIWKMTADAFAVSTDGGKTWNAGMDSKGNAVVNVLSAIGIRFDWAKGGTLTLGGENNVNGLLRILDAAGNEIGLWDKKGIWAENVVLKGEVSTKNDKHHSYIRMSNGGLEILSKVSGTNYESVLRMHSSKVLDMDNLPLGYTPQMVLNKKCAGFSFLFDPGTGSIPTDWTFGKTGIKDNSTSFPGTKSGKAEFSDGSYLEFKNGCLIGGKTASGTTF